MPNCDRWYIECSLRRPQVKGDFKIQINPNLPKKEQKKRQMEIQFYYDWYAKDTKGFSCGNKA